jgi:selenocysteine lyase/cysteine desulfurase
MRRAEPARVWSSRKGCGNLAKSPETEHQEQFMLPSQRAHFDIPSEVAYLNAASFSPLPRATQDAARAAVARKGQPWKLADDFPASQHARARAAAAALIGAEANVVALVSSVAYGVAIAGKVLSPARGSRVLVLENDHTSPVLEWIARAEAQGFTVETVPQPADGDWTAAVLEAIERPGAAPVSLASISSVHWCDGGLLDMQKIRDALRRHGAALLVDATHSVGVIATDVKMLDPDFLIFPTYKWVLGPYGRAFVYIARRYQEGVPLEQTASGRRNVRAENPVYFADTRYQPDARRYDMGERDHFISMEMAAIGMEMMAAWGADAVVERLAALTRRISDGLAASNALRPDERFRAPHILSLRFPNNALAEVIARLAREEIYVASRLGRMRISPHVYNDEADADRFVAAVTRAMS